MSNGDILTLAFLEEHYVLNEKTIDQIGFETGIKPQTVFYYLRRHGVKTRPRGSRRSQKHDLLGLPPFGRLTVLEEAKKNRRGTFWLCECLCGQQTVVASSDLKSGHTISCGCYAEERQPYRSWKGHGEISGTYWSDLRKGAESHDLAFNITIEEAWSLYLKQERRCAMTGWLIGFARNRKTNKEEQTASLDRIEPSLGYFLTNVQWVHKDINRMKQSYSNERLVELCRAVVEYVGLEKVK